MVVLAAQWFSAAPGGDASFSVEFTYTTFETNTKIDPAAIQPYETSRPEYVRFTQPEKYIESDDPEIVRLADKIAAGESNPYNWREILRLYYWKFLLQSTEPGLEWREIPAVAHPG